MPISSQHIEKVAEPMWNPFSSSYPELQLGWVAWKKAHGLIKSQATAHAKYQALGDHCDEDEDEGDKRFWCWNYPFFQTWRFNITLGNQTHFPRGPLSPLSTSVLLSGRIRRICGAVSSVWLREKNRGRNSLNQGEGLTSCRIFFRTKNPTGTQQKMKKPLGFPVDSGRECFQWFGLPSVGWYMG